jgi:hypothetical protein
MEVTARTKDGKEIGKIEKHYHTQATNCLNSNMVYGAQNKSSYVRDTSLQPFQAKTEQLEFDLPVDDKGAPTVRTVDVTVELNYEIQNPDNKILIQKVTREVTLDR